MQPELKKEAALRLKIAAGHLNGVRRMVEEERYCVDVMKQLSAVQASLERVQGIILRNHLSTCVSQAVREGRGEAIIDELLAALKYEKSLVDGRTGSVLESAQQELGDSPPGDGPCASVPQTDAAHAKNDTNPPYGEASSGS